MRVPSKNSQKWLEETLHLRDTLSVMHYDTKETQELEARLKNAEKNYLSARRYALLRVRAKTLGITVTELSHRIRSGREIFSCSITGTSCCMY